MLKGKKIFLSSVERDDLPKLMEWRNNEVLRKFFREYREINTDMQNKWYEKIVLDDKSTIMYSIRLLKDNKLLGCCGISYINWINRHADLSLYIGWDNKYIDKEGYAEESLELMICYGFENLGLNKLWTEIYEFDNLKIDLYESLGFKLDGILRDHYFYGGKWWNSHIYSKLNK